jgi:competence protein ComEA
MFTRAEKGYLALALGLLAAGSGLKAWRLSGVRIGPFPDPSFQSVADSRTRASADTGDAGEKRTSDSLESQGPASPASDSGSLIPSGSLVNDSSNPPFVESPEGARTAANTARTAPRSLSPHPPAAKSAFTGKVDLNRAPAAELTRVKGIGEKTALAIVEYRTAHGPFRDLRDLLQVKGIGEKKLEKLEPYLIL